MNTPYSQAASYGYSQLEGELHDDPGTPGPITLRVCLLFCVGMLVLVSNNRALTESESFLTQVVVVILGAAAVVLGFLGRGWRIRLPIEAVLLVLFCVWAATGFFLVGQEYSTFYRTNYLRLCKTVGMYCLILNIVRARKDYLWMLSGYLLAAMATGILSPEIFTFRSDAVTRTYQRVSGITGDANSTALLGMMCAMALLCRGSAANSRFWKFAWLLPIPLCVWLVLISGSRSGMLGAILFALLSYFFYIRGQLRDYGAASKLKGFIIGAGIMTALLMALIASPFWVRIQLTFGYAKYASTVSRQGDLVRQRMAMSGMQLLARHPLMGVGYGMYRFRVGEVDPGLLTKVSHNTWVEAVTGTGLPGVSIWFMSFFMLTRRAWKLRKNPTLALKDRGMASICLVFIVFWWFRSLFFVHLSETEVLPFMAGIAGYLVTLTEAHGLKPYPQVAAYTTSQQQPLRPVYNLQGGQ